MFKNILVGVDGSEHGMRAARTAGELARTLAADLWVVIAYEPLPTELGEPFLQQAIAGRMLQSDQILNNALAEIGTIPGALRKEVLEGPPAEAILSVAKTRSADLIIMGTRGLGRLASVVLGSQSQKVAANAECPVMLVR